MNLRSYRIVYYYPPIALHPRLFELQGKVIFMNVTDLPAGIDTEMFKTKNISDRSLRNYPLLQQYVKLNIKTIIIPEGVEKIDSIQNRELTSIQLPNSLKEFVDYSNNGVFCGCNNLKKISLPDSFNPCIDMIVENSGIVEVSVGMNAEVFVKLRSQKQNIKIVFRNTNVIVFTSDMRFRGHMATITCVKGELYVDGQPIDHISHFEDDESDEDDWM